MNSVPTTAQLAEHVPVRIERTDHLVLTVQNVKATCDFYRRVLGMQVVTFGQERKALSFGNHKN